MKRSNTIQDFWNKIDIKGPDDCWLWQGRGGRYGVFSWRNREWLSHRFSWALANNHDLNVPIPTNEFVCHTCDIKLCCNPRHLYLGNHASNTQDAHDRNVFYKGEKIITSKLTEQDILDIRSMPYGRRGDNKRIREKYNISRDQVANIINRKHWRHI